MLNLSSFGHVSPVSLQLDFLHCFSLSLRFFVLQNLAKVLGTKKAYIATDMDIDAQLYHRTYTQETYIEDSTFFMTVLAISSLI